MMMLSKHCSHNRTGEIEHLREIRVVMLCWSKNLVPIKSCLFGFFPRTAYSQRQLKDRRHSNQNLGSIFLFKNPFAVMDFTHPFHTTPKNKSWKQGRWQLPWPHRFSAFHAQVELAVTTGRTDWKYRGLGITVTTAGTRWAGAKGAHSRDSQQLVTDLHPSPPAVSIYMLC